MVRIRSEIVFLVVLTLTALIVRNSLHVFAADTLEAEARTAITNAENIVLDCYSAVVNAEKAGANVTDLLSVLNEAGASLSNASLEYEIGNFSSSIYFANLTQQKLNGFVAEAEVLRKSATQKGTLDFMVNVVGSTVGAISIICGGVVAWSLLKKKYEKTGSVTQ